MRKSLIASPFKALSPAEIAFNRLNGMFSIYKPPDMDLLQIYNKLKKIFYKGINELPNREVEDIIKIDEKKNLVYLDKNLADTVQGKFIYKLQYLI